MQQSLFPADDIRPQPTVSSSFKDALNLAQYEAVTTVDKPVLVIAGAGTGKTRTLVYKVAYLVDQGIPPENILLLTFTRKAAQEMLLRASLLMDSACENVVGGTFHAVANMLLRRYGHHLGYASNFTILDRSDSEGIVNLLKSSLHLTGSGKRFPAKRMIINIISQAVNKSMSIAELMEERYQHLLLYLDDIKMIHEQYVKFKFEHGLMDYDDLLVNFKQVLVEQPLVREEISERFQYIMVDEYQDTNRTQAKIVKMIAHTHNNVMIVGDDSQSIYSFRGADFRNIMDFPSIFPDTRIIRLEENYRSTQSILSVANAIIEKAREKFTKTLYTRIEGGQKPVVFSAGDESDQARFIARKIVAMRDEGKPLSNIAVLFRSGYHSYKLELELSNRQIIFEKRGGQKLTESAHIKDVVSYLRLLCNPHDLLSWNRVLLLLPKVGPQTARKILKTIRGAEDPLADLKQFPAKGVWEKGYAALLAMLESVAGEFLSPAGQFERVLEYYQDIFERVYHDDYPRRSKDLDQLKIILEGYTDLQSFIDDAALDPPEPSDTGEGDDRSQDRLVLSTVHSAKGLEWDTVFIIHLVEGKFPSAQASSEEELEEERRLFYVASTRAKQNLFYTYPRRVQGHDRFASFGMVSSFLDNLPPDLLQSGRAGNTYVQAEPLEVSKNTKQFTSPTAGNKDMTLFQEGVQVLHPFFGQGKVEALKGARTVEVFFPRHGKKTLHLDYARLEVVS